MTTKPTPTVKTMADASGLQIPVKLIPKHDIEADKIARRILAKAESLQERLIAFKQKSLEACDGWYRQLLEQMERNSKNTTTLKGNFTMFSFDRSIKIEVRIGTKIEFDSNIDLAKIKIDEYLAEITRGSNEEVATIVNHAFTTTKGQLDAKRILQLFSLTIKHKLWIEAMDYLKSSIKTNITKRYMAIWKRDEQGEYQPLILQFSNL